MADHGIFGAELRRRRLNAGLSLTGLARLSHYSKGYLSRIETGAVAPNRKIAWICDSALGAGGALAAVVPSSGPSRDGPQHGRRPLLGLPGDTIHFTGRVAELERLATLLGGAATSSGCAVVCAIDGMAGVGKTALAIHSVHWLAGRFRDGCMFFDLHGYTGTLPPVSPADALDRVLRRLGVPGELIPCDVDERTALYRDRLAGRNLIVVLDNACSAEQVRPLLPVTSGCAALVTSRRRLTALDDAYHLTLDVLPGAAAVALFRSVAREDDAGDAEMIGRIVEYCGRLPLAIRIAAARHRDRG